MRGLTILLSLIIIFLTIHYVSMQPTQTRSAAIQKPQVKLGVAMDGYPNEKGEVASLEKALGKPVSTISIYKQFGLVYNKNFIASHMEYSKLQGKRVLIAWEPWNPQEGLTQKVDYLQAIATGKQDTYTKEFARSIKKYGGPVTIRFGHEMNGDWYPWGNRPKTYIAAYRRIVSIFRRERVANVRWMWSINAENVPVTPIATVARFYPGNDVVDEIGIDGFNFGSTAKHSTWRSFNTVFSASYKFVTTSYKKPVSISETASAEEGGDKAAWVKDMFASLPLNFPLVSEIIWFHILKETDWRIDSTTSSLGAFRQSL